MAKPVPKETPLNEMSLREMQEQYYAIQQCQKEWFPTTKQYYIYQEHLDQLSTMIQEKKLIMLITGDP